MKISMRLYKRYKAGKFLSWYVELPDGRRRSLKTRNADAANRAYRKIKRDALAGRVAVLTGQCSRTLGQFQQEFLDWQDDAITSKKTRSANRLGLDQLVAVAGETIRLDMLGQKHIDQLIAQCRKRGCKVATINNYIRHAKAVLRKAEEWGSVKESPLAKVSQLRQERHLPGYLQRSDIPRLLAGIKDIDLRRYVVAYIATGRRRSELVGLDWMDVSLGAGRYIISKSKSHLERSYKINGLFRSVLESIGEKDSGPVFERWKHPDTLTHQVKKALVDAGFGHLHLHSLRHTYASLKAAEGRSLLEIQHLLGHSDMAATKIYSHLTEDHLDDIGEVEIGPVDLNGG